MKKIFLLLLSMSMSLVSLTLRAQLPVQICEKCGHQTIKGDLNRDSCLDVCDVNYILSLMFDITPTPVENVVLSQTYATLNVGDSLRLTAQIQPQTADIHTVCWTSDDEDIATVDASGLIKAVGAGTTTITCRALGGKGVEATCKITVKKSAIIYGDLTVETQNAEKIDVTSYTLRAHIDGLETVSSGTYSIFFYYSSTNQNPTSGNSNRVTPTYDGGDMSYTLTDLDMTSTYYYRIAFVPFSGNICYGAVRSFTVEDILTPGPEVYLGQGITLASCDLGASSPEGKGNQYAWGEVEPKTDFRKSDYQYYSTNAEIYLGIGEEIKGTEYDAATKELGSEWYTPSKGDIGNLGFLCTCKSISYRGNSGYLLTSSSTGNSVFIPKSNHWTSTVNGEPQSSTAYYFTNTSFGYTERYSGCYIRAMKGSMQWDDYVDLGLPSGTLWATRNVGADSPSDYGLYFAWGETTGYTSDTSDGHLFDWSDYKWCNTYAPNMTKYSTNTEFWDSSLGTSPDHKTELDDEDDAAIANWGNDWSMPTNAQIKELCTNCTWTWASVNGTNGIKGTGTNGNSIFLPYAGYRSCGSIYNDGYRGYCWSRTLDSQYPETAWTMYFAYSSFNLDFFSRSCGRSVRAVRVSE